MIRALVSGRLHDAPQSRMSQSGNPFTTAKLRADGKDSATLRGKPRPSSEARPPSRRPARQPEPAGVPFDDGDHKKDPDMEAKLTAELPGIMAWGVRGCLDWQREGLRAPEAVKAATEGYQQEQDVLAAWLADCCIVKRTADAKAADLYASYADWCEQSGEHPEPQRRWGMRLTERGFQRQKRMAGHFWLGIGLLSMTHMTQDTPEKAKVLAPKNLAGKSAESGSYGAYGSCPPVDANPDREVF